MSYLNYDGLAYFKSKLTNWVDQNYLSKTNTGNLTVAGNVTFTNPITGDLDGKAKKDWLGQKIDETYIKNLRSENTGQLSLIYGDNHEKTISIDTAVTQIRSTANEMYPVLLCYDANAEVNQISKSVKYGHDVAINPAYGYLYANSYIVRHPSYNRTIANSSRVEWMIDFRDNVFNPTSQIYSYLDPTSQGGEHRMELRLYGNPLSQYLNTPNHNEATDAVSIGVGATTGEKLTFFGYCPSTPIYEEDGETLRKSLVRGDQYGKDIITRDWLNLNGSFTGLVHTTMNETIDGTKTFVKKIVANDGMNATGNIATDTLTVRQDASIGRDLTVTRNETVGGTLGVTGASTLDGNVHMLHNLDVDGTANIDGNETVGGTLTTTGKITGSNGLKITGNTTTDTLTVVNGATVGTTLGVNGKTTMSGGLAVTSGTITDTLTVTSGATISGGATVATGNLTVTSGGVTASNGTGTFKNLSVTSNGTFGGTITANTANIGSGGLTVTGPSNLNGGTTTTTLTASTINATSANIKNLKITSGGSIVNNEGDEYVTTVINNKKNVIVSALIAPNGGLQKDSNNQISVKTGDGIQVSGGYVTTRLKTNGGLQYEGSANAKTISVKAGTGITVDSKGINIDFAALKENNEGDFYKLMEDFADAQRISSSNGKNHFYVDGTNGNDNTTAIVDPNDNTKKILRGDPRAPFKTIQACIDYITKVYNFSSVNSYINCQNIDETEMLVLPSFNRTTAEITIRAVKFDNTTSRGQGTVITESNYNASGIGYTTPYVLKITRNPVSSSRYCISTTGTGVWNLRNFDLIMNDSALISSGGHQAAIQATDYSTCALRLCRFTFNRANNRYWTNGLTTGQHVIFINSYALCELNGYIQIIGNDVVPATVLSTINGYNFDASGNSGTTYPTNLNSTTDIGKIFRITSGDDAGDYVWTGAEWEEITTGTSASSDKRKLNAIMISDRATVRVQDTRPAETDVADGTNTIGIKKPIVFSGRFNRLIICNSMFVRNKAFLSEANVSKVTDTDYRFYLYAGGTARLDNTIKYGSLPQANFNGQGDKFLGTDDTNADGTERKSSVEFDTYSWYK